MQRAVVQFEQEIEDGFRLDEKQTFKQFAEYFIGLKAAEGAADNTLRNHRSYLRILEPHIGNIKLSDLKPGHISTAFKAISEIKAEYFIFSADVSELAKQDGLRINDYVRKIGAEQYQQVVRNKR